MLKGSEHIKKDIFNRSSYTESVNPEGNMPAHGREDSEWIIQKGFQESPRAGFELLFRRYHKVLCSHAVRFVYSKEVAEDIVSDVFCRFWKTRAYESVNSSYRYYLFRSVRNEAYNYLKLEFHRFENLEDTAYNISGLSAQPDNVAQYEEVLRQVESLVESLPPQCRRVFLLSRFEGKKYQEIADELDISIKTVEVHIGKALELMRRGLKNHWI